MQLELNEKINILQNEADNLHAVVLHGDPKNTAFCAGADLKEVHAIVNYHNQQRKENTCNNDNDKLSIPMFQFMQENAKNFKNLPCPTFSYINGPAFGGGSELTTWTDLRIIENGTNNNSPYQSKVSFAHKHMGLSPSWNGGIYLSEILNSKAKAYKIISSAEIMKPEKLMEIGFGDILLEDDKNKNTSLSNNEILQEILTEEIKPFLGRSVEQSHAFKACLNEDKCQLEVASNLMGRELNVRSVQKAFDRVVNKK